MTPKKTIFVSQVFYPDQESTGQLLSSLLEELARDGADFEVLAGFPADSILHGVCGSEENWGGIRIRRGGMRLGYKRSLLTRAAGYGSYCIWLAWRLLFFTSSKSYVLAVTNPPFAPVLVHWISLVRGWPYCIIMHDVYPDGLVAVGRLSGRSLITKGWRWLNRKALGSARLVFVLGRDMAALCLNRYSLNAEKLHYTPHWSPVLFPKGVAAESTMLWKKLGCKHEFVVQYSGNMGLWHDINCIIQAAELLRQDSRIKFLMIGRGMRRAAAEQLSLDRGLQNVIWLPFQPLELLADSLACCHAALISQRAGLEGVAVPCKLYGILAAGRAVLAQVPAESETALVVREEDCGLVIPPGDAQALANAVRELADDRDRTAAMGKNGYEACLSKYSLGIAATRFKQILEVS